MKTKMKFFLSAVMIMCVFISNLGYINAAPMGVDNNANQDIEANDVANMIDQIEQELEKKGTSVINELIKMNDELQSQCDSVKKGTDEYNRISRLIQLNEEDIQFYTEYKSEQRMEASFEDIIDEGVLTIGAWFLSNQYYLAWELLMHSRDNNNPNSIYYPNYGNRVLASTFVVQARQGLHGTSGSSSFENVGTAVQKDLYYAIHNYDYVYSSSNHKLTITDIYDYEPGIYDGIAQTAINLMYYAQVIHVITPYNVCIIV